nr:MAG TPA: hypothetical protein [Caudoviricetes sp.]
MKKYVSRKKNNLAIKTIINGMKEILVLFILRNFMIYCLK